MTKPKRGDRVLAWNDDKSQAVERIFIDNVEDLYQRFNYSYLTIDPISAYSTIYKHVELIEDEIKLWDVVEYNKIFFVVTEITERQYRAFLPDTGRVNFFEKHELKIRKDLVARAPSYNKRHKWNTDRFYSQDEFKTENDNNTNLVWPSRPTDFRIDEVKE